MPGNIMPVCDRRSEPSPRFHLIMVTDIYYEGLPSNQTVCKIADRCECVFLCVCRVFVEEARTNRKTSVK